MKERKHWKQVVATVMSAALVLGTVWLPADMSQVLAAEITEPEQTCAHHIHDEECGYEASGVCTYECPICKVQELIDALPAAEEISEENAQTVEACLDAIDEAKQVLTDDELDMLNIEKYIAAAQALGEVYDVQTLEEGVARLESNGQVYETIEAAIDAAEATDTITLLQNTVQSGNWIYITGKNLTFDLGGYVLTGRPCVYDKASLTLKNGTLKGVDGYAVAVYGGNEDEPGYSHLTVEASAVVESTCYAVILYQDLVDKNTAFGSTIDIYGTLKGNLFVLGNIKTDLATAKNPSVINFHDGAVLEAEADNVGIALNGAAKLNIDKAKITAGTGVEVRAGELVVNGAEIVATAAPTETNPNGSGTTTEGAGIAVAQHTTKLPISVIINSGEISGHTAFYQANPQNNEQSAVDKVDIQINGGEYTATGDGTNSVYSENKESFIYGGSFSNDIENKYIPAGNATIKREDGRFVIGVDENAVAEVNGHGYTTVQAAVDAIAASDSKSGTITMLKDSTENVTIPKDVEITLNIPENITLRNDGGHTITNNGTLLISGEGTVDNVTHAKAAVYNNGIVTLDGCTFSRSAEASTSSKDNGGNSFYVLLNHGKMTINDGTTVKFSDENTGKYSSMIENGYQSYKSGKESSGYVEGTNQKNPKLTINGGVFNGGLNTVKNDDGGVLNIIEGTFTNTTQAAILNWNVAMISGGTFTVDTNYCVIMNGKDTTNTSSDDEVLNKGELTITGGNFAAPSGINAIGKFASNTDMSDVNISGGTFSSKVPEEYCAEGYNPTDVDENGNYTVCGHTRITAVAATAALCEEAGNIAYWYCPDCGRYFSDASLSNEITQEDTIIPAAGHTLTKVGAKPATCTEDGNREYYECSLCGKYFADENGTQEIQKDSWLIKAAHTYGDWKVTKAATETEKGEKQRTCSVCGAVEKAEIPALGHSHSYGSDWEWDSKNHWHECSCGEKADISAHTYDGWTVTKEPTAEAAGIRETRCTVCGFRVVEPIPATGSGVNTSANVAQTGDNSAPAVWMTLLMMAGAVLIISRKKYYK